MYYKIKNDILFREYAEYGYITDNTKFEYRRLHDIRYSPGEKYVSKVGAVMLSTLSKTPQHIDKIIDKLLQVFTNVGHSILKQDTIEFFQEFVELKYLCCGETFEDCIQQETHFQPLQQETGIMHTKVKDDNLPKEHFQPNDMFRYIHFDLTTACNERCVHCFIPPNDLQETIESALFYRILEEARNMNLINVTLSGGEPLLHKDFAKFLARCRKLDLSVNILSNLTLLTDEIIIEMKKNPLLSVQTSLYSMNPTIHDSITKQNGSYEKTKNAISRLLDADIMLQISCPILKQNKDCFLDVIHYGNKNHIAVSVEPVIFATYDHSCSNLVNRLSLKEIEEVVDKQLSDDYVDFMKKTALETEKLVGDDSICAICRHSLCISPSGKVFPCVGWSTNIIGDLNFQSLHEIWETSHEIKQLRQIKRSQFSKCVACKNRGYCKVCMMCNSNENIDGNPFYINDFRCKVATMVHSKVENY